MVETYSGCGNLGCSNGGLDTITSIIQNALFVDLLSTASGKTSAMSPSLTTCTLKVRLKLYADIENHNRVIFQFIRDRILKGTLTRRK